MESETKYQIGAQGPACVALLLCEKKIRRRQLPESVRRPKAVRAKNFDLGSFRTMKDQPKPGYYMIVGCPKGQFRAGRCLVGTDLHKIIAPMSKCR